MDDPFAFLGASSDDEDDSPPTLREKFADYLDANPRFWVLFERFALEAAQAGRKKFSAWLIINRIRWEALIRTSDDHYDFKIANDYIALCSRKFMCDHPEHDGLFNTKAMKRN